MKEDFLHFVWRLRRFHTFDLKTTIGQAIEIIDLGQHNQHAGPDFLNARIKVEGTLWAGNVEMHLRSSDWLQHQHQHDPNYDNVILHVVLEEDIPILHRDGSRIPCLNLRKYVSVGIAKRYLRMLHNEDWIPCHNQLNDVPAIKRNIWLDRLLVERLEDKTNALSQRLQNNKGDWEETFYQSLAWGFGLKVNADPFLMLAESLPLKTLLRYKNKLISMEALLFGQAGMLTADFTDPYPQQLQKEYEHLRRKHKLTSISGNHWKYLRMRPANFPSIRIAQWATLLFRTGSLFNKMLVARNLKEIENAFAVELSNYWQTHHRFDKAGKQSRKTLGKTTIRLLVINVIAPFLFLYGKERGNDELRERALQLLEEIPAERNQVLDQWAKLGVKPQQAAQSQALLQLKRNYCDQKRCLDCSIGCHILNQKTRTEVKEEELLYLPIWWLEPAAEPMLKGA